MPDPQVADAPKPAAVAPTFADRLNAAAAEVEAAHQSVVDTESAKQAADAAAETARQAFVDASVRRDSAVAAAQSVLSEA